MGVDHPQFGTFCGICFKSLTRETCVEDVDGVKWDICPGECARQAYIQERPPAEVDLAMRVVSPDE